MNRSIAPIIFLAALLGGLLLGLSVEPFSDRSTIGILLPLSGSATDQGRWIKQGLDLALEELNSKPGPKIELRYEDTRGNPQRAVSAYRNLLGRERTAAVITWGSGVGLALTPLVNADNIVQVGIATAAPSYTTVGDYTFRNFPSAIDETKFLAETLIKKLEQFKIAAVIQNNDYGISCVEAFRRSYEQQGGSLIFEETIEPEQTDFRSQILRLKRQDVPFVYLAIYSTEGALFIQQARTLGFTGQFIASVAILGDEQFFSLGRNTADGLVVVTSAPNFIGSSSPRVAAFTRRFTERFGSRPHAGHLYAARAYDTLHLLHDALEHCGQIGGPCLRDQLFTVENYQGAAGELSFDEAGDITTSFNLQVVRDGEFVAFTP